MSYWSVLGIEATRDAATIKRAYATRLRDCHPEDDPDGFQKLRAAYESALRYATPKKPRRFTATIDPKVRRKQSMPDIPEAAVLALLELAAPNAVVPPRPAETETQPAPEVVVHLDEPPKPPVKTETAPPTRPEPAPRPKPQPDPASVLQAQHDARCRALWQMATQGAEAEALQVALKDLLDSEPMESVGVHGRTERWLAELIVNNTPRSDPLVAPAINYFGWRADRLGRDNDPSKRVLKRADDLVFLDGLRRPQSVHADAWRALNAKPTRMRVWINRLAPSLAGAVRTLLELLRRERPVLLDEVDRDGVAWWEQRFSQPQIPALLGWAAFLGALLASLAFLPDLRRIGPMPWSLAYSPLVCFGAAAALLAGGLYGVARPRHRWMNGKHITAPMWQRLGWAPASLALVLISAVAPPSIWLTPAIVILSLAPVYWVLITGEPDTRNDVGDPWRIVKFWNPIWMLVSVVVAFLLRPAPRFPWQARAIFNFTYLAFFWLALLPVLAGPTWPWPQMTAPILAGMFVFTWGAGSLIQAWWGDVSETARRWLRGSLAAVVVLAYAALSAVSATSGLGALAAALCIVAVLAHKTVDTELKPKAWLWRDVAMRYGWIAWLIGLTPLLGMASAPLRRVELPWGAWLLTGPAVVVGVSLLGPLLARLRKPTPKPA